ncbi:MAG: tyrosine--tRNA ligase [Pseudomonadales bacterium]|nr:tyrosine--tRNA ligase [Candidatus Woesebacteria bacterium]MCB9802293.1 tyrosine--tRNA ligase [Pseudomonadales bacterium]
MSNTTTDTVLDRGVAEILPSKQTLAKVMEEKKLRVYLGIDPTGAALTLGHSVVLRKLQQFASLGHEAILLIGNGTVRIGDPTGKDASRPELTDEEISINFQNWKEQASKVLDFTSIKIKKNGDWLDALTYADIVKLLAKTTVGQLMERDMFQKRVTEEKPIHGHEIIYPLLQGYDSVAMDVDLEIGGSDQLFNMMMGRTLQKEYNNKEKWVLTTPLIVGTDGRKMSKSYGNFVALTDEPGSMYGKLMSIRDESIMPYFEVLTDTSNEDLRATQDALQAGKNPITTKKQLAHTITQMYHGVKKADEAQEHFEKTVQDNQLPETMPQVSLGKTPLTILEALKIIAPDKSSSQLRRLIEEGGVTVFPDEEKPRGVATMIDPVKTTVIKLGKRVYVQIV